jgi:glutaredoxin 3
MSEKVIIYTKPGCPYCAAAKASLKAEGIEYEEFNVKKDPEALQRMLEINGGRRVVPTIVRGEEVTVGFGGT